MMRLPVKRGEGLITSLMFLYVFGTLTFYYILKPLRSGLFLKNFPASHLPYAYFMTALLAGTLATLIFKIHRRVSVIKMLTGTNVAIIATLLYFRWAMGRDITYLPYVYFVYLQIVSVLSTTQFWLLAGYVFDSQQSKRIFPLLGSGAIAGSMAGSFIPGFLSQRLTTQSMLLICISVCGLLILLSHLAWRRRRPDAERAGVRKFEQSQTRTIDLLRLAFGSRHITLIILLIFLTLIASQISDWQMDEAAQAAYRDLPKQQMENSINELRGRFYFFTNVIGIVLQFTLTGFVVRHFGISAAILFLPASLLLTSVGVFALPTLWTAVLCLGSNSVFRYSINRVGFELLYLPLTPEVRKRIKVFIDVFVDRLGRAVAGVIILAMTGTVVMLGLRGTSVAVMLLCSGCIAVCLALRRSYVEAFRQKLVRNEVDLTEIRRFVNDPASLRLLTSALDSPQERQILNALRLLQSTRGFDFGAKLLPLVRHPSAAVREQAARTLVALPGDHAAVAEGLLADPDGGVRQAAVEVLCSHAGTDAAARIDALLNHDRMEVRTAVARWLSDNPALPYHPAAALVEALMSQQGPGSAPAKLAAARLSARLPAPEAVPLLRACLRDGNPEISGAAALAAGKAGRLEVVIDTVRLLTDRRLRPAMREALVAYGARIAGTLGDLLANPEEDIGLRREIPWVLARIEIPRSADVLTDSLGTPDRLLKYRVIKALNRLHGQRPDLQLPLQAIEVHIYAEVRGYYETLSALQALSSGRGVPVSKLLAKSLRESLDERQELIFRLLGLHYSQRDIHAAYKAIKTGTPDRRASAIEYLESLLQKDLRSMLQPMLEETSPERTLERISKLFAVPPPTPDEALDQLLRRDERWLKSCALHHVGAARLSRFKERCAELTRHADPLIQETALWATRSLDA